MLVRRCQRAIHQLAVLRAGEVNPLRFVEAIEERRRKQREPEERRRGPSERTYDAGARPNGRAHDALRYIPASPYSSIASACGSGTTVFRLPTRNPAAAARKRRPTSRIVESRPTRATCTLTIASGCAAAPRGQWIGGDSSRAARSSRFQSTDTSSRTTERCWSTRRSGIVVELLGRPATLVPVVVVDQRMAASTAARTSAASASDMS